MSAHQALGRVFQCCARKEFPFDRCSRNGRYCVKEKNGTDYHLCKYHYFLWEEDQYQGGAYGARWHRIFNVKPGTFTRKEYEDRITGFNGFYDEPTRLIRLETLMPLTKEGSTGNLGSLGFTVHTSGMSFEVLDVLGGNRYVVRREFKVNIGDSIRESDSGSETEDDEEFRASIQMEISPRNQHLSNDSSDDVSSVISIDGSVGSLESDSSADSLESIDIQCKARVWGDGSGLDRCSEQVVNGCDFCKRHQQNFEECPEPCEFKHKKDGKVCIKGLHFGRVDKVYNYSNIPGFPVGVVSTVPIFDRDGFICIQWKNAEAKEIVKKALRNGAQFHPLSKEERGTAPKPRKM